MTQRQSELWKNAKGNGRLAGILGGAAAVAGAAYLAGRKGRAA